MAEKPVHFIPMKIETSIEEIVIVVFCTLITQIKLSAHELAHRMHTRFNVERAEAFLSVRNQ